MDIYIIPTVDFDEEEEENEAIELVLYNFTWNATYMEDEIILF